MKMAKETENRFLGLFGKKPIIGMIHLAGKSGRERITRAIDELNIYQTEGVDAAIIENYHGTVEDVYETLKQRSKIGSRIIRGVNVLRNPYYGFELAHKFGAKFIQFDSIQTQDLNLKVYNELREKYPDILVLGGVGFKYIKPTGNPLKADLEEAKSRCDAIVTTGTGTGIETPTEKLREYKKLLGNFPLIVGAGVNLGNVYDQLKIADGAIIGSYFKVNNDTSNYIDRTKVRALMDIANRAR